MTLHITITDAGRAELIQNNHLGFNAVTIVAVAVGSAQYVPSRTQTALGNEVTRLGSIAGGAVGDGILHVTARDESDAAYNVGEFGLITDKGTLFAVCSQPAAEGWIIQKAAPSIMLLASDVLLDDIDAEQIQFGSVEFMNPPATTERAGVVELATAAEMAAGTDSQRAATPAGVAQETAKRQPLDATLTALAQLVTAANQLIYATAADQFAMTPLTAFMRTLLDDADATEALATLGAAPLASPVFTGVPTVPTPPTTDNSLRAANTAYVCAAIAAVVGAAPETLNEIHELARAIGNDPNFSVTLANALAGKLGRDETAAAAFKLPMLDLRDSSDLYGPPSALHGKGTITGFTNGALLGIPGLNSTDYGVAELSGQWTDVSGLGGAAQRVFRTHAGRQFYQHQEGAADVWSKWYETQNIGAAARSQNRTEVLNVAIADTVPGLTIYTKIPAGPALIPALRITGGLSSYTSPVEILVSWYFYEGAVYMPTALVNAAGERPTVSVGVHNGMIAVQLSFAGGEAYIPRLAVEAINFDGYAVAAEYLQGWTYSWALEPLSGLVACEQRNVINDKTLRQLAPGLDGTGAHGTWPISIGGYAEYAGVTGRSAYLNWTAHGGHGSGDGSHVVFDASIGLAPNGAPIGSVDPSVAWTPGLPTMMGWNGGATYGVRVDRARHAEALTHDIIINGVHLNAGSNVSLSAPAAGGTADAANLLNNRIPLPYSALPKDYPLGVSSMFVGPESGWPHYGTVLTVRGYAEGGGTLQIYSPYGTEFGGGRVLTRYGNYTVETGGNAWSVWSGNAGEGYSGVFGTTGYRMFPDGTMFQWGTALVPTDANMTHATVVNLPATYPVANHFAMASWNAPPFSAGLGQCGARPNGNNSIVITSGGAIVGPHQVNWYSIGQWKVA